MTRKPQTAKASTRRSTSARKDANSGSRSARAASGSKRTTRAAQSGTTKARKASSGRVQIRGPRKAVARSQVAGDTQIRPAEVTAGLTAGAISSAVIAAVSPPRSKDEAIERLKAADGEIGRFVSFEELKELTQQTEAAVGLVREGESAGPSELTGEALPSPEELQQMRILNLRRGFALRRQILNETLGVQEVADLLATERQTPHDRIKAKTLVAIKDKGQWRFPIWQFDPAGPDGVVEGLPEVLRALRAAMSPLARISWFVTPAPQLDGQSPIEALKDGDVDQVISAAYAVGAS